MNKKFYLLLVVLIISLTLNFVLFFQAVQSKEYSYFGVEFSSPITDDVIFGTIEMESYDNAGNLERSNTYDFCIYHSQRFNKVLWKTDSSDPCFKDGYSMKIHITASTFAGEKFTEYTCTIPLTESLHVNYYEFDNTWGLDYNGGFKQGYIVDFEISRSTGGELIIKQQSI